MKGKDAEEERQAKKWLEETYNLCFEEKEIVVKTSDWNWLLYAIPQMGKVIGWMFGYLKKKDIQQIEEWIEEDIKEKRVMLMVKGIFKELKEENND